MAEPEWLHKVRAAVEEVLHHRHGGKVEVFIHPKPEPGARDISINPYLNGSRKSRVEHIDDAD